MEKKKSKPSSISSETSSLFDMVRETGGKYATMKSSGSRAHLILRFPLGFILLLLLVAEVTVYILVRVFVVFLEMTVARRSYTKEGKALHDKRKQAKNYAEYQETCKLLDEHENRTHWKHEKESSHYDAELIEECLTQYKEARLRGDITSLLDSMILIKNFGGILNLPLYNKTWSGTKELIEEYVEETVACIEFISTYTTSDPQLIEKRIEFLKTAKSEFGNTSFSLSGGAMLGIYHLGVIKALLNLNMLPKIFSGSSAGAVLGAYVGVKTDEELHADFSDTTYIAEMLGGEDGPFPGSKWWMGQRLFEKGYIHEVTDFLESLKRILGDITFKEAHDRTGRTLVIPCTPVKSKVRGNPSVMLSHMTAPDVPIMYAVAASCTVPYLMQSIGIVERARGADGGFLRDEKGEYVYKPYLDTVSKRMNVIDELSSRKKQTHDDGVQMRDGTFQSDMPFSHLLGTYNCKFNLTCQTNPHILPFFFSHRGEAGKPVKTWHREGGGWRGGFILSLAEYLLKEEMIKTLKVMSTFRLLFDHLGVDWSTIFLQDFKGDLTLTPPLYPSEYWLLMQNLPSGAVGRKIVDRRISVGENITWKAVPLLKNRISIQKALDRAVKMHIPDISPGSPYASSIGGDSGSGSE